MPIFDISKSITDIFQITSSSPMSSLSPLVENHVFRLNAQMLKLERDKRRLSRGQRLATDNCRQHKVYYAYLLKKQQLLFKHSRAQREDLYSMSLFFPPPPRFPWTPVSPCFSPPAFSLSSFHACCLLLPSSTDAVMSGDAVRIGKVEAKIVTADTQAHEVQIQISRRLKHLAEAIKREQEYEEAMRTVCHKMILKSEEVHKYQPCETFLCDHCRGKKEKRVRRPEKRRYNDEVEEVGEEERQFQGMVRRIVSKMRKLSF